MIPEHNAAWLALLFTLACGAPSPAPDDSTQPRAATPPAATQAGEARDTAPPATREAGAATLAGSPWSPDFTPPPPPRTESLQLRVLGPDWAEFDYEALMGSRDHLRRTLHWGSWPRANFTLEENRTDLERHLGEFERREAYAYTVLDADGEQCVGCIYLNPTRGEERSVMLAMWVVEPELEFDLDDQLLRTVVDWLEREWPVDRLFVLLHEENERGTRVAREAGFTPADGNEPNHVILERALR